MSKFNLRDISDRLTASRDVETVVDEFLAYLQAVQPDWHPTLAFYEVSRDALVNIYLRDKGKLQRRDAVFPVDKLPARLVRKFFHPSAFFNGPDRKMLLAKLFQSSPHYEPDPLEGPALQPLTARVSWQSCVCMPLADQDDLLAILIIVSPKKKAFDSRTISEIIPVKSLAALALSQRLHHRGAAAHATAATAHARRMDEQAAAEFQTRVRELQAQSEHLAQDNQEKTQRLESLTQELSKLDLDSNRYRGELENVKQQLGALEEQSSSATAHLHEAYTQLTWAQTRVNELQRTMDFMHEVFGVLSQEHDEHEFSRTLVSWFCEQFSVERCSLMRVDDERESLSIAAQRGLDPVLAGRIKVRIGQGVAGWVAHNRKPLFVRLKTDASPVDTVGLDTYNSDSFISVPLLYRNRLLGVLNLSNKKDGEPFDDMDLQRAVIAGAVLAMAVGSRESMRRAAAWV